LAGLTIALNPSLRRPATLSAPLAVALPPAMPADPAAVSYVP